MRKNGCGLPFDKLRTGLDEFFSTAPKLLVSDVIMSKFVSRVLYYSTLPHMNVSKVGVERDLKKLEEAVLGIMRVEDEDSGLYLVVDGKQENLMCRKVE